MINIERKLQHGWGLESFLQVFNCNSEEELFEVLKRDSSRKTAKSYIARMKKNSLKNGDDIIIQSKEADKPIETLEKEEAPIQVETTIEQIVEIKQEEVAQNKGWLSKIIGFFKKILK